VTEIAPNMRTASYIDFRVWSSNGKRGVSVAAMKDFAKGELEGDYVADETGL
jgi:hypothetical protein